VTGPDTVVLGLGFPTLIPQDGKAAMQTAGVPGIKLSGMIFDAGPKNSPARLVVGSGVGWDSNRAATGVIVNGDHVSAYGLFVEHYQNFDVIWNGQDGEDVFFQNEMPYDPPSQAAWMSSPTTDGYAAFLVTPRVHSFEGYWMGSYSFFDLGVPILATQAFQSPDTSGVQFHGILTIFLNKTTGTAGSSR
jgi:hypothetical protein